MSDVEADEVRATLEAKRREICALLGGTQEDAEPVALDQSQQGRLSRIDAMARRELAVAARRRRTQDLARIEAALQRLDQGEWGCCVRCGEDIEVGRLQLDPATPLCRGCAG